MLYSIIEYFKYNNLKLYFLNNLKYIDNIKNVVYN